MGKDGGATPFPEGWRRGSAAVAGHRRQGDAMRRTIQAVLGGFPRYVPVTGANACRSRSVQQFYVSAVGS
jgi:hypothetical protein